VALIHPGPGPVTVSDTCRGPLPVQKSSASELAINSEFGRKPPPGRCLRSSWPSDWSRPTSRSCLRLQPPVWAPRPPVLSESCSRVLPPYLLLLLAAAACIQVQIRAPVPGHRRLRRRRRCQPTLHNQPLPFSGPAAGAFSAARNQLLLDSWDFLCCMGVSGLLQVGI
jgi:hypothetical protein